MKSASVIVLILVIIFAFFLWPRGSSFVDKENLTNYPPQNETIVAFGDSLVVGVGAETEGGFVTMLSERIERPIQNFGRGADTTESALSRVDEALSAEPGIALILLGGNDYLRRIEKEETMTNLREIIKRFQENGAVTMVLGVRGGLLKDNYGKAYRELAEETGSAYVSNVLDGLIGNDQYMDDAIHPNEDGYKLITDKVEPILREMLE